MPRIKERQNYNQKQWIKIANRQGYDFLNIAVNLLLI
jgi:hypothetical protein